MEPYLYGLLFLLVVVVMSYAIHASVLNERCANLSQDLKAAKEELREVNQQWRRSDVEAADLYGIARLAIENVAEDVGRDIRHKRAFAKSGSGEGRLRVLFDSWERAYPGAAKKLARDDK